MAEKDNEADGGVQALQDTIYALSVGGGVSPGGFDASEHRVDDCSHWRQQQQQQQPSAATFDKGEGENDASEAGTAVGGGGGSDSAQDRDTINSDGEILGGENDKGVGSRDQAEELRTEKAADDKVIMTMDHARGEGEGEGGAEEEGWGDGEGDTYSDDEYENSYEDEQDNAEEEREGGARRPPPVENSMVHEDPHGDSVESSMVTCADGGGVAGGTSAKDGDDDGGGVNGKEDGVPRTDGAASKAGGEGVGPGESRADSVKSRPDNVVVEERNGGENDGSKRFALSQVPVYLSGGKKASSIPCLCSPEGFS